MEPSHRAEILQDGGEKDGELRFFRISCLLNFSHFWGDGNPSTIEQVEKVRTFSQGTQQVRSIRSVRSVVYVALASHSQLNLLSTGVYE